MLETGKNISGLPLEQTATAVVPAVQPEALVAPKLSPTVETPFAERAFAHQLIFAFSGDSVQQARKEMDALAENAPHLWARLINRLKEDLEIAKAAKISLNDYYATGGAEVLDLAQEHCAINGITVRRAQVPGREHEALEILPSDATPLNRKVKECVEKEPAQRVFFDPRSTSEHGCLGLHDAQSKVLFASETAIVFGAFKSIDPTRCFGHEVDHFEFSQLLKQGVISPFHIGFAVQSGPGFPGLEPWSRAFLGEEFVNLKRDMAQRGHDIKRWEDSSLEEVQFLRQLCSALNQHTQKAFDKMDAIATRLSANILLDHPNVEYPPGLLQEVGKYKGLPDILLSPVSVHDHKSGNNMLVFIPFHRAELKTVLAAGMPETELEKGGKAVDVPPEKMPLLKNLVKKRVEDFVVALCGNMEDHLELVKG